MISDTIDMGEVIDEDGRIGRILYLKELEKLQCGYFYCVNSLEYSLVLSNFTLSRVVDFHFSGVLYFVFCLFWD